MNARVLFSQDQPSPALLEKNCDEDQEDMTPTPINQADTAWMLVATALVLLMTPALGFFYGGLVRSKNALNTMMMSVSALGFVGIGWALAGYSIAFAPGNALTGDMSRAFLSGV